MFGASNRLADEAESYQGCPGNKKAKADFSKIDLAQTGSSGEWVELGDV